MSLLDTLSDPSNLDSLTEIGKENPAEFITKLLELINGLDANQYEMQISCSLLLIKYFLVPKNGLPYDLISKYQRVFERQSLEILLKLIRFNSKRVFRILAVVIVLYIIYTPDSLNFFLSSLKESFINIDETSSSEEITHNCLLFIVFEEIFRSRLISVYKIQSEIIPLLKSTAYHCDSSNLDCIIDFCLEYYPYNTTYDEFMDLIIILIGKYAQYCANKLFRLAKIYVKTHSDKYLFDKGFLINMIETALSIIPEISDENTLCVLFSFVKRCVKYSKEMIINNISFLSAIVQATLKFQMLLDYADLIKSEDMMVRSPFKLIGIIVNMLVECDVFHKLLDETVYNLLRSPKHNEIIIGLLNLIFVCRYSDTALFQELRGTIGSVMEILLYVDASSLLGIYTLKSLNEIFKYQQKKADKYRFEYLNFEKDHLWIQLFTLARDIIRKQSSPSNNDLMFALFSISQSFSELFKENQGINFQYIQDVFEIFDFLLQNNPIYLNSFAYVLCNYIRKAGFNDSLDGIFCYFVEKFNYALDHEDSALIDIVFNVMDALMGKNVSEQILINFSVKLRDVQSNIMQRELTFLCSLIPFFTLSIFNNASSESLEAILNLLSNNAIIIQNTVILENIIRFLGKCAEFDSMTDYTPYIVEFLLNALNDPCFTHQMFFDILNSFHLCLQRGILSLTPYINSFTSILNEYCSKIPFSGISIEIDMDSISCCFLCYIDILRNYMQVFVEQQATNELFNSIFNHICNLLNISKTSNNDYLAENISYNTIEYILTLLKIIVDFGSTGLCKILCKKLRTRNLWLDYFDSFIGRSTRVDFDQKKFWVEYIKPKIYRL